MLERLRGVAGVAQLARGAAVSRVDRAGGRRWHEPGGDGRPLAAGELTGLAAGAGPGGGRDAPAGGDPPGHHPGEHRDSRDGAPCLVDFALATSFAEIRPEFTHHAEIAGTLAYLAPEQTGRTGRPVDQRADLYALGATLYELATGEPPFGTGDPLRLIHDHLARVPVPPARRTRPCRRRCPRSSCTCWRRNRTTGTRPRTAWSMTWSGCATRRHTRQRLRSGSASMMFPLRLLPPSRLAGRDDEVAALEAAFADALAGRCRGVLVAGAPGVGKTALVDQLRPVVTGGDGWFVAASSTSTAGTWSSTRSIRRSARWAGCCWPSRRMSWPSCARILAEVGPNAGLLTAMLPEFAALLAVPPDPGDPLTAQARAQRAGAAVLRAVASRKRPVVMFLDDLQWAGRTPLGFVDLVLSEEPIEGLLLVGAYREDDVDAAHPLAAPLSRWRDQAGCGICGWTTCRLRAWSPWSRRCCMLTRPRPRAWPR